MLTILETILFLVFVAISLLHVYWAFGGKVGLDKALPTSGNETDKLFQPGMLMTLIVAIGLLYFGLYYGPFGLNVLYPSFVLKDLGWFISTIFIVRAIGDFKYVGFFKKVKDTDFATFDTKFFSKISLFLGVVALLVAFLRN